MNNVPLCYRKQRTYDKTASGNPVQTAVNISETLLRYFSIKLLPLRIYLEEENPRIGANLWRIAFRYPDSHTSFRRVRGIRQRPAERLTRASGARRDM